MNCQVDHPNHYNCGQIEVIDLIEEWGLGFCLGNAVKYICRSGKKGGPSGEKMDLEKAVWYLNRAIEKREKFFFRRDRVIPKFYDMGVHGTRGAALYSIYSHMMNYDLNHLEVAKFALSKELEKYEEDK